MTKSRSDGPGSGSGAKPVTVSRRQSRHASRDRRLEPTDEEIQRIDGIAGDLGDLVGFESDASKSWYYRDDRDDRDDDRDRDDRDDRDLMIVPDDGTGPHHGEPLSAFSSIVRNMRPVAQRRIYVKPSDRQAAKAKI